MPTLTNNETESHPVWGNAVSNVVDHSIKFVVQYFTKKVKVTSTNDAYEVILKNCPFESLGSIKEYKTLVLDQNNKALGAVSFTEFATPQKLTVLFELIASLKSSAKVVVGQNNPFKQNVIPSDFDDELAEQFLDFGRKNHLPVIEQLMLSTNSFTLVGSNQNLNRQTAQYL